MKLNFRNLPVGDLPYTDIKSCKIMMLRLYEKIPFLPELPIMNINDSLRKRSFSGLSCLTEKDGKLLLPETSSEDFLTEILSIDKIFSSSKLSDFEQFAVDAPFLDMFEAMLEKFQPEYTYFNLIGPFSFANMIFNRNPSSLLTDRLYRKYIIQSIGCKALWFIYFVKSISPKTNPIIMFNENLLYKFGTIKRTNENITNDIVTTLFSNIFERLKKENASIGVQSFEKCNWQLIFDTNMADIISFDAFNNFDNLNILAQSVNKFLAQGGILNWAFVPVMNEKAIRTLNFEQLYTKLLNVIESLASRGVSADLLYKNLTISTQGDLSKYPILFAEKALMIAQQLSQKLPTSSGTIQYDN